MAKKDKLLQEIRQRTNNVRFNELNKLMLLWGFEPKDVSEGVIYRHSLSKVMPYVCPHKHKGQGKQLHQCYVKECIKAIDDLIDREALNEKNND